MSNSQQRVNIGFAASVLFSVLVVVVGYGWFFGQYQEKFYPGITIMDVDVAGLTQAEAKTKLLQELPALTSGVMTLSGASNTLASSSAELGLAYELDQPLTTAWGMGRSGTPLQRAWEVTQLVWEPQNVPVHTVFDTARVEAFVREFATRNDQPGTAPSLTLGSSGKVETLDLERGQAGYATSIPDTAAMIQELAGTEQASVAAILSPTNTPLTEEQAVASLERAKKFVGHQGVWKSVDVTLELNDQQLIKLLNWPAGINDQRLAETTDEWQKKVERAPQNAAFIYDPATLKVTTFTPPRDGLQLDHAATENQLRNWIATIDQQAVPAAEAPKPEPHQVELALAVTPPEKTLADTNNLGIVERIGVGESEYAHSIPSRIYNVALASERINNYIVKPGEEFSFNQAIGDVSAATGFKPAYVIKGGQTVLGDGGGVCQVSTTLFRSVLNAGLDITKRKAHSYRVSYYELDQKPGIDATVYSGDVDLRFINDTGHHILIHTQTDSKNLYMKIELFGTSDGRTAQITEHKTWDARPAPAPVYMTDPTLAPGVVKQVDWSASGIRASFKHTIYDKNGQVKSEETYASNYIPWSAKYLRGP